MSWLFTKRGKTFLFSVDMRNTDSTGITPGLSAIFKDTSFDYICE